jgi:hypothetical protein
MQGVDVWVRIHPVVGWQQAACPTTHHLHT